MANLDIFWVAKLTPKGIVSVGPFPTKAAARGHALVQSTDLWQVYDFDPIQNLVKRTPSQDLNLHHEK